VALAACPFESPVDPLTIGRGGNGTGGGGATPGSSIVGSWRNVLATTVSIVDTRWSFTSGGACSRTVITTALDLGTENTAVRACTFTLGNGSVSIVFQGSSFVSAFSVGFSGGDLLLDGFRLHRIG
jgi:hypothetical protein